jgi:hypothetical protein
MEEVKSVGTDRKAKKRKEIKRKRRQSTKLAEIYDRILPIVGATELFARLPDWSREKIRQFRFPQPEICYGDDFTGGDERESLREAVKGAFDRCVFQTADGHEISAQDYFRVVASLGMLTQVLRWNPDHPLAGLATQTNAAVSRIYDEIANTQAWRLFADFDKALAEFTRIDTAIYWYALEFEQASSLKRVMRITLHKSPPQVRRFIRNEGPRPAFRCGASLGPDGIAWIDVPASLFGSEKPVEYPLYVQSHAIRSLHERIMYPGAMLHHWMWESFLFPAVVRNARGEYLIEFQISDYKLGYFVAEVVEESILVTTFLFLTMQGTPEAAALHKQLQLTRPDIERLELDKLPTYMCTDLQEDEELVRIFETCGCGHLFRIAKPETAVEWESGYARNIRLYLKMKIT